MRLCPAPSRRHGERSVADAQQRTESLPNPEEWLGTARGGDASLRGAGINRCWWLHGVKSLAVLINSCSLAQTQNTSLHTVTTLVTRFGAAIDRCTSAVVVAAPRAHARLHATSTTAVVRSSSSPSAQDRQRAPQHYTTLGGHGRTDRHRVVGPLWMIQICANQDPCVASCPRSLSSCPPVPRSCLIVVAFKVFKDNECASHDFEKETRS